ncbi:MAG: HIT family hydrolase [Phycisphaerae bacterium]|nr:HIT family hydrolase [Phycisphaerae bacterium]HAW96690.1 HIT family hydrolase [Phycisphaerales bacterium]
MNHANLWAPWRMAYLRSIADLPEDQEAKAKDSNFFRTYWASPEEDETNLVVHRTEHGMILLNRYPYANGHLLIALGEAAPTLADYDEHQRRIFWELVDAASMLVRNSLNPQGLNIGVNEGSAAGAGVPEHLHAHVVPRWGGDTNFMTTIGGVRVSPDALESVASAYRESIKGGALDA